MKAQQDNKPLVQLSGVVVTEEAFELPYVTVYNKTLKKGVISDGYGFFSIVCQPGDTLYFSKKGYSSSPFWVPDTLNENRYSIIHMLSRDTLEMPDIRVYPWPNKEAFAQHFVNMNPYEDDIRRAGILRDELGWERTLMMDANQVWSVDESVANMRRLAAFEPLWIEEPTSPDDILGHATIRQRIAPIGVATGEHCHNRVMFKQMFQAGALDFCQLDAARLGGLNEVLIVLLMAAKYDVPVCPHGGGVGLCEYVQNIALFDYIAVSASLHNRVLEYVDHLHEHFLDPVVIRRGRYMPPQRPGYSIEMHADTLERYQYPNGAVWLDINRS